jgi:hypothetical protein
LCDEDRSGDHRNTDAHPIAFLYRHALEVYLKTVVDFGDSLLWLRGKPMKGRSQILKGHNLATLLPSVQDIFGLVDTSNVWDIPLCSSFVDIERIVNAVDHIPHDALRYPVRIGKAKGVKQNKTVKLLPSGLGFNVLTFVKKMNALLNVLDAVAKRASDTFQTEALGIIGHAEKRD